MSEATTPAPVEVTQEDRDALERIDDALGFLMEDERELVLQAFAAHRIQALSARPVQADLVEALESAIASIEDDRGLDDAICCSGHMCGCQAATHRQLLLHDLRATLTRATGDGA